MRRSVKICSTFHEEIGEMNPVSCVFMCLIFSSFLKKLSPRRAPGGGGYSEVYTPLALSESHTRSPVKEIEGLYNFTLLIHYNAVCESDRSPFGEILGCNFIVPIHIPCGRLTRQIWGCNFTYSYSMQ